MFILCNSDNIIKKKIINKNGCYVFSCIRHISVTSNVKCTVDAVQLLLSLEFRQNAADFV